MGAPSHHLAHAVPQPPGPPLMQLSPPSTPTPATAERHADTHVPRLPPRHWSRLAPPREPHADAYDGCYATRPLNPTMPHATHNTAPLPPTPDKTQRQTQPTAPPRNKNATPALNHHPLPQAPKGTMLPLHIPNAPHPPARPTSSHPKPSAWTYTTHRTRTCARRAVHTWTTQRPSGPGALSPMRSTEPA